MASDFFIRPNGVGFEEMKIHDIKLEIPNVLQFGILGKIGVEAVLIFCLIVLCLSKLVVYKYMWSNKMMPADFLFLLDQIMDHLLAFGMLLFYSLEVALPDPLTSYLGSWVAIVQLYFGVGAVSHRIIFSFFMAIYRVLYLKAHR